MGTNYLLELFSYLEKKDIEYCVIGDSESLPEVIDGDVDIVFSNENYILAPEILKDFCGSSGCRLVQELKHEVTASYYALSYTDESSKNYYLHPDICSDYYRDTRLLISSEQILRNRKRAKYQNGQEKSFYIAAPEIDFIYYLIKKIEKGSVNQKQFDHIISRYYEAETRCKDMALNYFTSAEVGDVIRVIQENELNSLNAMLASLAHGLLVNRRATTLDRYKNILRGLKRIIQPTGLTISFLGPDGAGKTAIGEYLERDLAPAFRGVRRFHLKPSALLKSRVQPEINVSNPHSQPLRGWVASFIKLGYFLADYIWGYVSLIQLLKARSHLIIFDRYFHDLLIDPVRYRYGAPLSLAKFTSIFIPKPDLFIVLDAPAEVIQARKQEVSLAETERQRKSYLKFAESRSNCIVLDTSIGIEETAFQGSTQILEFMEKRLKKRLKL